MVKPAGEQGWILRSAAIARGIGAAVGAIGLTTLLGWWLNLPTLRSLSPRLAEMKPNTGLALLLCGAGLTLGAGDSRRRYGRMACGVGVMCVGVLSLLQYAVSLPRVLESWLVMGRYEGSNFRVTIGASVAFCCAGAGLCLTSWPARRPSPARAAESTFAYATLLIGALALLGYLYSARSLYLTTVFTTMALHTAAGIALVGAGLLLSRPRQGMVRLIGSSGAGGGLARPLLLFFLILAPLMGWARLRGEELEYYDTRFGLALLVWCMIVLGGAMVWWTAAALDRNDRWRATLQEDLADSISREHATAAQRGAILDAIPAAVVLLDKDGLVKAVNRRWGSLASTHGEASPIDDEPFERWAGRTLGAEAGAWARVAQAVGLVLAGERPGFSTELSIVARPAADGAQTVGSNGAERDRWVELRVAPVIGADGSRAPGSQGLPVGVVVTVTDVTERRQLEEQLVHAQRLEAVGRLAGGVAHDFNNLLTAVLGHAALARSESHAGRPPTASLAAIEQAARSGAELTHELLAFGRRQVLSTRVVNIADLVQNVRRLADRSLGETVELAVAIPRGVWPTRVDPGRIEQVLMNLVLNARDALNQAAAVGSAGRRGPGGGTGAPGKIVIEACNTTVEGEDRTLPSGIAPGNYVCVSVSDSGVGMSKAVMARVFEPFFTTKEHGKGTGLGLATSFGIVKQHGGHIAVYSEEGHGSTFRVYLPAAAGEAAPAPEGRQPPAAPAGSERILLVDDHPGARGAVAGMLRSLGYTVVEAGDVTEAERIAEREAQCIDMLLSDVVLPDGKGPDLARRIRGFCPDAAVLFISGYTANALSGNGELEDGAVFLSKPFSRDELAAKVRQAIDAAAQRGDNG